MAAMFKTIFAWLGLFHVRLHGRAHQLPLLRDITLRDIGNGLDSGAFTSLDLVRAYFDRIHETHESLRAIVESNPDALDIARALDDERALNGRRGPLHGVPILIKDNIATADKLNTTAGSFCLEGARPPRDASVVAALRSAGAIILGKANPTEWANFRSNHGSGGWSARGGQTLGAFFDHQDPGGSSSGAAVVASVGLAFASIGTETDGSIICPAAYNGVVGIKPTVGLSSRDLVIPGSWRQDSVGPIARTVHDAAILLSAIAGADPRDHNTSRRTFVEVPNYAEHCRMSSMKGARVGIPRNAIQGSDAEVESFDAAVASLRAGGAVFREVDFPDFNDFNELDKDKLLLTEFREGLAEYLAQLRSNPSGINNLADVVTFTETDPREEFPLHDIDGLKDALESAPSSDPEYRRVLNRLRHHVDEAGLLAVLEGSDLDAVILPEASKNATSLAAAGGFPVITIPLGVFPANHPVQRNKRGNLVRRGPGIPFGLQIMGRHFDEAKLIGLAHAFEQTLADRPRATPLVVPTTELKDSTQKRPNQSPTEL